ncbi:unnamed protein product [Closterium sp. NIES-64]|nr:unnamed protein product [Closterium sp. NIES-64]
MMQPSPLMPYPQSSGPVHMTPQAAQSQIVCTGCRTLLVYPNNASNVRCALCSTITPVPPAGTEMAQLVCGGCRTLLMYVRGATSVQCSCCHTVNLSMESSQVAHVNCGGCGMTLMYAYGAQSVKCAVCQFVTQVGSSLRPLPVQQRQYAPPPTQPAQVAPAQSTTSSRTVVVENPMTMDDTGKLLGSPVIKRADALDSCQWMCKTLPLLH